MWESECWLDLANGRWVGGIPGNQLFLTFVAKVGKCYLVGTRALHMEIAINDDFRSDALVLTE